MKIERDNQFHVIYQQEISTSINYPINLINQKSYPQATEEKRHLFFLYVLQYGGHSASNCISNCLAVPAGSGAAGGLDGCSGARDFFAMAFCDIF